MNWRWAALKNGFKDATAYRVEFLSEVLGYAILPAAIQWVLWYAIFKTGGAKELGGMSYSDMIHYTLISILFSQVRGGDQDFEIQEMIRTGQLSNYLLRPVGVLQFVYIRGIAPKLLISGFGLALGLGIAAALGLSPLKMVLAMGLALIGNLIHFQIGSVLATAGFIWEDAYALLMVKNLAVSILCGEILPLNLFPENWQWIWKSTPFYLYVYGPTQFALGHWSIIQMGQAFLIAAAWVVALWGAIHLSWKWGLRRYVSIGG